MPGITILSLCTAVGGGLFAAYVDFHNDEPQAPMLVILLCSFLVGMLAPKFAWLCAAVTASVFALTHGIAPRFGVQPESPLEGGPWWSLFILVLPAMLSAYFGAGARRLFAWN